MKRNAQVLTSVTAAVFVLFTAAACDFLGLSGPSGPGIIHANLVSPQPDAEASVVQLAEGAAVIELTGPTGIDPIRCDNGQVFFDRDGNTTRIVVILDEPGQISFEMRVTDVGELPSATILQVAGDDNALRTSVSEYEIEWVQLADSDVIDNLGGL